MATLEIIFLSVVFMVIIVRSEEPLQCFQCSSQLPPLVGKNCSHGVSRVFQKQCPPTSEGCYIDVYSETEFSRGCLEPEFVRYWACKESAEGCYVCKTPNCNNIDITHPSKRRCFQCNTRAECEETYEPNLCSNWIILDQEMTCFTDFDENGVAIRKGCTNPHSKTTRSKRSDDSSFRWACKNNYCNSYRKDDHLVCKNYIGLRNAYDRSGKDEHCKEFNKDLPGCFFMNYENGTVRAGCTSSLSLRELKQCMNGDIACQYCRHSECNKKLELITVCLQIDSKSQARHDQICKDSSSRCYLKTDPKKIKLYSAGCESNAVIDHTDPHTFFCENVEADVYCNDPEVIKSNNRACYQCYGEECEWDLKNNHKVVCDDSVTHCYTVVGRDNLLQRGCHKPKVEMDHDCEMGMYDCKLCNENYCNSAFYTPIHPFHASELIPDEDYIYDGEQLILRNGLTEPFKCFQCRSDNYYDQSCDDKAQYLEPLPCFHLYGPMPSSCFIRYLVDEDVIERGCGDDLEPYTFATCASNVFKECMVCNEDSCNNMQAYVGKSKSGNYFDRGQKKVERIIETIVPDGAERLQFSLFGLILITLVINWIWT